MAFVMVISNLKSSRWFKIYSRKTPEKGLKGSLLPVLKVKIVRIQKTIGHLGTSFLDLLDAVFTIKKSSWLKRYWWKTTKNIFCAASHSCQHTKNAQNNTQKKIFLFHLMNVYNYIFACILAPNHRIFNFYLYITNVKFVDREVKNWSF